MINRIVSRPARPVLLSTLIAVLVPPGGSAAAQPRVIRDISYASAGEQVLRLDLHLPAEGDSPHPLVVWVHGGAWRSGSKESVPIASLASDGWAIASVEYRLSPIAPFPAQVHDIKAAIRFLRAQADRYGIDPERIAIAGASAGGHLAALVGTSDREGPLEGQIGEARDQRSDVQAIVSFYGASNLQSILGQSTAHGLSVRVPALQLLLGGQPDERPDTARLASPVAHVDADVPPLLLIHGDADPQMPIEQSRELAAAYAHARRPVEFEIVPGGQHGGTEFYAPEMLQRVAAFLDRHLGSGTAR